MSKGRLLKSINSGCNDGASKDRDPLIVAAEEWRAMRLWLDAMICEWQGLEDQLARKARELEIDLADACQSGMPEARGMRALDARIEATQRRLIRRLRQVRGLEATTLAGAIAKVSLGLAAQGKFDWQDNARELIEEGIEELHLLAKGVPTRQGPAT
jgi:hypothetical protein